MKCSRSYPKLSQNYSRQVTIVPRLPADIQSEPKLRVRVRITEAKTRYAKLDADYESYANN